MWDSTQRDTDHAPSQDVYIGQELQTKTCIPTRPSNSSSRHFRRIQGTNANPLSELGNNSNGEKHAGTLNSGALDAPAADTSEEVVQDRVQEDAMQVEVPSSLNGKLKVCKAIIVSGSWVQSGPGRSHAT